MIRRAPGAALFLGVAALASEFGCAAFGLWLLAWAIMGPIWVGATAIGLARTGDPEASPLARWTGSIGMIQLAANAAGFAVGLARAAITEHAIEETAHSVELFCAREGRYPESLAELAASEVCIGCRGRMVRPQREQHPMAARMRRTNGFTGGRSVWICSTQKTSSTRLALARALQLIDPLEKSGDQRFELLDPALERSAVRTTGSRRGGRRIHALIMGRRDEILDPQPQVIGAMDLRTMRV